MKVKILYTALISLIAGGAMAQDCTFFFPQTEGTVWVRKGYDAKGNLQSVMSYQVDEVETLPSGQEVPFYCRFRPFYTASGLPLLSFHLPFFISPFPPSALCETDQS